MPDATSRIEEGFGENRLALRGNDLHSGDPIELQVRGAWAPARVEWSPNLGWYALVRQGKNDHRDLTVLLRPGLAARPIRDRSYER